MKKLVVLLLALMMVGAVAFAQTAPAAAAPAIQFSDTMSVGVQGQFNGNSTNAIASYDYWNNNSAMYNDLDLSYSSGNYGWFAEFDTQDGTGPTWDAMNGWLKFGSMAKLTVGWAWDTSFKTLGDVGYYSDFYGQGAILDLYPVSGLTLGYFLHATTTGDTASNVMGSSAFGIAYAMPNTFKFNATFKMSPNTNADMATASVAVLAVQNLTANAEAFMYNIGDSTAQEYKLTQTVAYAVGNITPGVVAYEYSFADSNVPFGFNVKPYVNYTMGNTTFTAYYKYYADNYYVATGATSPTTLSSTTTRNEFALYAKTLFDEHMTTWIGVVYDDKGSSDPLLNFSTFKVPLTVMYSF
ncbi:MAG TPA: hypothetical protein VMV90_06965 [Rectinemataceae bacterium]|nr:hypothetical protein [Rectinemataceae bacterium]